MYQGLKFLSVIHDPTQNNYQVINTQGTIIARFVDRLRAIIFAVRYEDLAAAKKKSVPL